MSDKAEMRHLAVKASAEALRSLADDMEAMAWPDRNEKGEPVVTLTMLRYIASQVHPTSADFASPHVPAVLADAWDEGFEAGSTWIPSGATGNPSDPPRNPYFQGGVR